MKHTITLSLQQITDLEVIKADLASQASKAYAMSENKTLHPWRNDNIAQGDRFLRQSCLVHDSISQIKKNG